MKFRSAFLLVCLLLAFSQCGRKVIFIDSGFIGIWNGHDAGSTYHLSIDDHSNAYWDKQTNGHFESAQGVARIRDNTLRIGFKHFSVDELPTVNDTTQQWVMVLSGVTYTR
jgi:hypothetical protein